MSVAFFVLVAFFVGTGTGLISPVLWPGAHAHRKTCRSHFFVLVGFLVGFFFGTGIV